MCSPRLGVLEFAARLLFGLPREVEELLSIVAAHLLLLLLLTLRRLILRLLLLRFVLWLLLLLFILLVLIFVLVLVLLLLLRQHQIVAGVFVGRIVAQGFLVGVDSLVVVFVEVMDVAHVVVGHSLHQFVLLALSGRDKLLQSIFAILLCEIGIAEIEGSTRAVRIGSKGAPIVVFGRFVVAGTKGFVALVHQCPFTRLCRGRHDAAQEEKNCEEAFHKSEGITSAAERGGSGRRKHFAFQKGEARSATREKGGGQRLGIAR